jgi:hypothetical protein
MRKCEKKEMFYSREGHRWQYDACPLLAGYIRLQTQSCNVQDISFPMQQKLHERASVLRYTYNTCLVCRSKHSVWTTSQSYTVFVWKNSSSYVVLANVDGLGTTYNVTFGDDCPHSTKSSVQQLFPFVPCRLCCFLYPGFLLAFCLVYTLV